MTTADPQVPLMFSDPSLCLMIYDETIYLIAPMGRAVQQRARGKKQKSILKLIEQIY